MALEVGKSAIRSGRVCFLGELSGLGMVTVSSLGLSLVFACGETGEEGGREGRMISFFPYKVLEVLSPNTITWKITASTCEFWGHTIQFIAAL